MATELNSVGQSIRIQYEGKSHELVIRTRSDGLAPELLAKITGRTITTWLKVYSAIINDDWTALDGETPSDVIMTPEGSERHTAPEPHCTVFNKDYNGVSITVHSNDNGTKALGAYAGQTRAIDTLKKHKSELFQMQAPKPSPQNNPRRIPQQDTQQQPSGNQILPISAFVRATRSTGDGVMIETGKTDNPAWGDAVHAKVPFAEGKGQYAPGTIVLYPLSDHTQGHNVQVCSGNDKLLLSFQLLSGDDIAVWYGEDNIWQGKTMPSDWNKALSKLGLADATVNAGDFGHVPADYIAFKVGKKGEWQNFYGFFNKPEGQSTPENTERTSDKEWLDNRTPVSNSDIPF